MYYFFQIPSNQKVRFYYIYTISYFIVTNNVTIAEIVEQVWRKAVPLETFGKKMLPLPRAKAGKSTSQSSQAEKSRQQIWPQVT